MNEVNLNILDECTVKIEGLDVSTRQKCVSALKYFLPHARYSPAFKLGRWDGTQSFFTIGGKTYLNLLEKILPIIIDEGYELNINDHREKYDFNFEPITENFLADRMWPAGHRFAGQPIVLRDYQVQIVNECINNLQGITIAPTSAGKTIIVASLSKLAEKYGRTLVIVPNKNLVLQTEEDFRNIGLDVGVIFGDRKEFDKTHTICTWQSLNVLDKKSKDSLDEGQLEIFLNNLVAVICDEVHLVKNMGILHNLLTTVFAKLPIRWGLTGTIPEEEYNQVSLHSAIGPIIGTLSAKDLQDQGHLAKCNVNILQTLETAHYADYQAELKYLVTTKSRIEWLAKTIQVVSESGNTLVLVDRIETGKLLCDLIPHATFISGKITAKKRKEAYQEINLANNAIMIATFGTTSTGINIGRLFNLFLIEPGKSFVRTIQSIGRGLRKADDKDHVEIYDVCSNMKSSKKHLLKRIQFYKKVQYPYEISKITY
jgi:superfamily II DNA or RNA helicase